MLALQERVNTHYLQMDSVGRDLTAFSIETLSWKRQARELKASKEAVERERKELERRLTECTTELDKLRATSASSTAFSRAQQKIFAPGTLAFVLPDSHVGNLRALFRRRPGRYLRATIARADESDRRAQTPV